MAAVNEFQNVVDRLSARERETLSDYVRQVRDDLLAARSEEARVRIAEEFIVEAHDRLKPAGKK